MIGATRAAILGASGAGGGGAELAVGSFTKINTTGTQAITGVGFTPKAIIFWASGSNAASGTWDPNINQALGFTSGATESYAVSGSSVDAVGTSDTARRIAAKALSWVFTTGSGSGPEADLSSFDADGFTLNWTTNGNAYWDSIEVMFLAIGGDDVSAKVVNWTSPTATGNKAVTGVGFTPDVVLHAGSILTTVPSSGAQMNVGFGAMDAAGNQWTNALHASDAQATSDTARYQRTDKALAMQNNAVFEEAAYVSMDADGFTTNFTTAAASAYQYISLCLSGVDAKVGNFAKSTGGAPASQAVTGVGFEPGAVLLSSDIWTASTAVQAGATLTMGAYDGTSQRAVAQNDRDNLATTQAHSLWRNDSIIDMPDNQDPPTSAAEAEATSLDANGFSLNWRTNDATAREVLYLALR